MEFIVFQKNNIELIIVSHLLVNERVEIYDSSSHGIIHTTIKLKNEVARSKTKRQNYRLMGDDRTAGETTRVLSYN